MAQTASTLEDEIALILPSAFYVKFCQLLASVREAELERCAKIAERVSGSCYSHKRAGLIIAEEIRKGE